MLSTKHHMRRILWAALYALLSVWLGAFDLECRDGQRQTDQGAAYQPPVIDDTRARGRLLPNGEQQAQTIGYVDPGRVSSVKVPPCIGSGQPGAGSSCAKVCVGMPVGSTVSKVEGFAQPVRSPAWLPCDSKTCMNQTPDRAKAMFDPAGYVEERRPGNDRVCWVFRNWHPSRTVEVVLLTTFRAPKN
jgi:hypothetical protein